MELAELVLSVLPRALPRGAILAFVGAGGKTTGLYALAGELAADGARVLVTTTTMMYDPAGEGGRGLAGVEVIPELALDADRVSASAVASLEHALVRIGARAAPGRVLMVASENAGRRGQDQGRRTGAPWAIGPVFDYILVEADGSRRTSRQGAGPG